MFDWIYIFDIEIILGRKNVFTFYLIVLERKVKAIPEKVDNPPAYFFASSLHKTYKLEKGESKTKQAIS